MHLRFWGWSCPWVGEEVKCCCPLPWQALALEVCEGGEQISCGIRAFPSASSLVLSICPCSLLVVVWSVCAVGF